MQHIYQKIVIKVHHPNRYFWQKEKEKEKNVMGEIGGGNPRKENDNYGMAVKCQALYYVLSCVLLYIILLHLYSHPNGGVVIPIF